ncbi:hypothetical protein Tco_0794628 [Tanacetum coccineum]
MQNTSQTILSEVVYTTSPWKLTRHPTTESPGYIADSDSMEEDTDEDSIAYPVKPKDDKEDDDEDPKEDPSEEHEPEDDDEDPEEGTSYSAATHFGGVTDWYQSQGYREPGQILAMSSDNTSSAVTYMSISSYSNGPSWCIPLMNADELPKIDPYEEVAQQGQAPPLSPAYVPDPMELDEHVPVYVSEPEHPEHHVPSDDDIQRAQGLMMRIRGDERGGSRGVIPSEVMSLRLWILKVEEPSEGSDETESFKEDETAVTPPPPGHRGARISFKPQTLMAASTQTLINAFAAGSPPFPLPPTSPTYDQALLGHRAARIPESSAAAARPPRGRAADKAEDVGYVRSLQASEHRMMTSIEEVNLRVSYQAQAYLSSEARNRALLARLDTLETHMSRMEWQRQVAKDHEVRQIMRTHVLEARAQIDTVEDTGSSC